MTTTTSAPGQWERLGAILIQRRTALNPQWHGRGAFAEATGLSYRLVYDVEEGRRGNFGGATLAAIESAYQLETGAIRRFLDGGELESADGIPLSQPERAPRTRVNRSVPRTPALEPYAKVVELERKAGIPPRSPGEQDVWDTDVPVADEEKINFIAMMRLLNDRSMRESERGTGLTRRLSVAGNSPRMSG